MIKLNKNVLWFLKYWSDKLEFSCRMLLRELLKKLFWVENKSQSSIPQKGSSFRIQKSIEDFYRRLERAEVPTEIWDDLFRENPSENMPVKASSTMAFVGEKSEFISEHLTSLLRAQGSLLRPIPKAEQLLNVECGFLACLEKDVWYRKISTLFIATVVDSRKDNLCAKPLDCTAIRKSILEHSSLIRSYALRGDLTIEFGVFDLCRGQFLNEFSSLVT